MIAYLTSSPTKELSPQSPLPALYEENGFLSRLGRDWRGGRCLMIAGFPGEYARNDQMTAFYREAVENGGLEVECFHLWDGRREAMTKAQLSRYDVLFLAGGHVPTQAHWFEKIGLRTLLAGFEGLVIGTSAGSMNMARTVYHWPEEEGESLKPLSQLFAPGLGLAHTVVLPHYQKLKDSRLDGRRLVEDIACSHSRGRSFLAIPDGSYVRVEQGEERVFGESWLICDGELSRFSAQGESRVVWGKRKEIF